MFVCLLQTRVTRACVHASSLSLYHALYPHNLNHLSHVSVLTAQCPYRTVVIRPTARLCGVCARSCRVCISSCKMCTGLHFVLEVEPTPYFYLSPARLSRGLGVRQRLGVLANLGSSLVLATKAPLESWCLRLSSFLNLLRQPCFSNGTLVDVQLLRVDERRGPGSQVRCGLKSTKLEQKKKNWVRGGWSNPSRAAV
jgi:hypothetical protein